MSSGADFLLGDMGLKQKKAVKIHNSGELDIDGAVALMDSKKDGEALRTGLDKAVSALEALRKTGLIEALAYDVERHQTYGDVVLREQAERRLMDIAGEWPPAELVDGEWVQPKLRLNAIAVAALAKARAA